MCIRDYFPARIFRDFFPAQNASVRPNRRNLLRTHLTSSSRAYNTPPRSRNLFGSFSGVRTGRALVTRPSIVIRLECRVGFVRTNSTNGNLDIVHNYSRK